jgi:hypothetical protein
MQNISPHPRAGLSGNPVTLGLKFGLHAFAFNKPKRGNVKKLEIRNFAILSTAVLPPIS